VVSRPRTGANLATEQARGVSKFIWKPKSDIRQFAREF
jgi:hypothetical protein